MAKKLAILIILLVVSVLGHNCLAKNIRISQYAPIGTDQRSPAPSELYSIQAPSSYFSSTGVSESGGGFFASEGYVDIRRNIEPIYKEFFLKNKSYNIDVEIQGCGRALEGVLIEEEIDKNLGEFLNISVFIENPFNPFSKSTVTQLNLNDSTTAIKDLIESLIEIEEAHYLIYNNSLLIKIPRLNRQESIFYNYKIGSNNTGVYEIKTRFRLMDSRWSDLQKVDYVDVRPPEITINTKCDRYYAVKDEDLKVTYNFIHKSGWCNENNIFYVYPENSSKEYNIKYINGKEYTGDPFPINLSPLEEEKISLVLAYTSAGRHPLPALDINEATVYQADMELDVIEKLDIEWINLDIKWMQDNAVWITIVMLILSSLISAFASILSVYYSHKEIHLLIKRGEGTDTVSECQFEGFHTEADALQTNLNSKSDKEAREIAQEETAEQNDKA